MPEFNKTTKDELTLIWWNCQRLNSAFSNLSTRASDRPETKAAACLATNGRMDLLPRKLEMEGQHCPLVKVGMEHAQVCSIASE